MFKKNIILSVVAVATLFMSGCGGSSNSSTQKDKDEVVKKLPSVSNEVKSLAKSISNQGMLSSLAHSASSSTKHKRSRELYSDTVNCSNGGIMKTEMEFDPQAMQDPNFNYMDFNNTTTMRFENCLEDGQLSNGDMNMTVYMQGEDISTMMVYITDFTISDAEEEIKIFKNSSIKMETIDNLLIMTETMHATFGDQTYKTEALKVAQSFEGAKLSMYPISGKEMIDNEFYTVDSSYDASKTPMVMDEEGNIEKGGKFKYLNSKKHHITIETIEKNKMQISVDVDGDGKADQAEVVEI